MPTLFRNVCPNFLIASVNGNLLKKTLIQLKLIERNHFENVRYSIFTSYSISRKRLQGHTDSHRLTKIISQQSQIEKMPLIVISVLPENSSTRTHVKSHLDNKSMYVCMYELKSAKGESGLAYVSFIQCSPNFHTNTQPVLMEGVFCCNCELKQVLRAAAYTYMRSDNTLQMRSF